MTNEEIVCVFCEKILADPDDAYCFGCGDYICEDCDETFPMGSHIPDDHKK